MFFNGVDHRDHTRIVISVWCYGFSLRMLYILLNRLYRIRANLIILLLFEVVRCLFDRRC